MGWTYSHKPRGMKVKDFFAEEFNFDSDRATGKVLDCKVVKLRTAYLAFETVTKEDGKRTVFALVCLLHFAPRSYHNFGYKDMDEGMGPHRYDCPASILSMLTPPMNEWARQWRGMCRARKAA